ncbi:carbohydrate-binding family 9-like protein [Aquimarina hainanensis]|uniref:Carbohydrate-binding family 9-like protein n=1 Tax=Aquimarina hainanensis TaxID=1578017 RepID=A0ABW5NC95_9FLAO
MNWKRQTAMLCFLYVIGILGYAQSHTPNTYVAYQAIDSITVDGTAKEATWKNAVWSADFIDIEGTKIPKYKTQMKIAWDLHHLYIYAQMKEPHVWGDITKREAVVFHNNDFEVFIDPDGDGHTYYEIEVNALNTIWDLFITKPYREDNSILSDWNANGMKTAVAINGTLNNASDIDQGWSVEMAIPLRVFKKSYYQKINLKDQYWRLNFSRVNWDHDLVSGKYQRKKINNKLQPEYNWVWSPQGVINMHEPEKWGYVFFAEKKEPQRSFEIPADEKIKWKLFEYYRNQKDFYKKHKKWATFLKEIGHEEFVIENTTITPVLETHSQGWNLIVSSPFTERQLCIREDGKYTTKSLK